MKRPPKPSPSQIILSRSRSRFSNQSSIPDWIAIPSLPKKSQDDAEENENEEDIEFLGDRLSFKKNVKYYAKTYEHVLSEKHVEDVCRNIFRCFQAPVNYLEEYRNDFEPSKTASSSLQEARREHRTSMSVIKDLDDIFEHTTASLPTPVEKSSTDDAMAWLRKTFPDAELELLDRVCTRVMRLGQTNESEMRREMRRVAHIEMASSYSYKAAQIAMNAAHDASIASTVSETNMREAEVLDRDTRNARLVSEQAGKYAARLVEAVNESLILATCIRASRVARDASHSSSELCTHLDVEMKELNAISSAVNVSKDASRNACESQNIADRAVDDAVQTLNCQIQTAARVAEQASVSAQQSHINASSLVELVREHRDLSGVASWIASRAASDAFRYACDAKRVVSDAAASRAACVALEASDHANSVRNDMLRFMENMEDVRGVRARSARISIVSLTSIRNLFEFVRQNSHKHNPNQTQVRLF